MDPEANLNEQLEIARAIIEMIDTTTPEPDDSMGSWNAYDEAKADRNENIADMAHRLSELVLALDEWRRKGGFDPYTRRSQLDGAPLAEIRELLTYNWTDEERDYEECAHNGNSQQGHIFRSMRIIDSWLSDVTEE